MAAATCPSPSRMASRIEASSSAAARPSRCSTYSSASTEEETSNARTRASLQWSGACACAGVVTPTQSAPRTPANQPRTGSPVPGVFHARPGFLRRQRIAFLQELDRDVVRRAHECHVSVTRRSVDRDTIVHQMLAHVVNVVDAVGEMAEMPAVRRQALVTIPVIGQFDRTFLLAFGRHEDKREAPLFIVGAPCLLEAEQSVEFHRSVQVFHPDHGVQIANGHGVLLFDWLQG